MKGRSGVQHQARYRVQDQPGLRETLALFVSYGISPQKSSHAILYTSLKVCSASKSTARAWLFQGVEPLPPKAFPGWSSVGW